MALQIRTNSNLRSYNKHSWNMASYPEFLSRISKDGRIAYGFFAYRIIGGSCGVWGVGELCLFLVVGFVVGVFEAYAFEASVFAAFVIFNFWSILQTLIETPLGFQSFSKLLIAVVFVIFKGNFSKNRRVVWFWQSQSRSCCSP